MSTAQIVILAIGCFVLGFLACAWWWIFSTLGRILDERRARAEAMERDIEETRQEIRRGARRSEGRFRL
jgi:hypothetical protein